MKDKLIIILAMIICISAITYMSNNNNDINPLNAYAQEEVIIQNNPVILQREELPSHDEPWLVETDLYNQVITIYAKDEDGEYTQVVNQFPCSGGLIARRTESKTPYMLVEALDIEKKSYSVYRRDWGEYGWVNYLTHIWGEFFFHSVLYSDKSMNGFIRESYNDISFPASHGCIRVLSEDAKWMFENLRDDSYFDLTKNNSNPELSQMYQPMPPRGRSSVATRPPDYGIKVTKAPDVEWEILNYHPEGYVPGNFTD